jgi:hypothetical protein
MAELVRCKSCGFITGRSRVRDVCPACGVPVKNMLPYADPVSPGRRRILALDIHPVIDHFSEAFSFSTLVLAVAGLFPHGMLDIYLFDTLIMLSFFTPLVVLLSFLSGLLDGKTRFRRVTTPILTKKMILGGTFFVLSCLMLALALQSGFPEGWLLKAYIVLNSGAFVCGFFLGLFGRGLMGAELPG